MSTVLWIALIGGAFVAGVTIVAALVVVRNHEPFAAILGVLGLGLCAWSFGRLGSVYANVDVLVYAFGFAIGAFGGGYALASALLDRLSHVAPLAATEPAMDVQSATLIVFACAEPESYDPRSTSRELARLADERLVDLSIGVTPFMYAAQKARYRAIGGTSPERGQVRQLAEAVERILGDRVFSRVETAWCDGPDELPRRIVEAVANGSRTLVVAVTSVGESLEMVNAKRSIDRLRLAESGVSVVYTRPLWATERIISVLASRILAAADDPETTGVALIAHGQPETREQSNASFDADENGFVSRVRMLLADKGIAENRVRVAWAEWRDPDVTSTVRHLGALGCSRVLVVPACFPFDNLATRLDIPIGIRQARLEATISVVTLNAWNDDPAVPDALAEEIREAYEESLGSASGR